MKQYKNRMVYRFICLLMLVCVFALSFKVIPLHAAKSKTTKDKEVTDYSFGSLMYTVYTESQTAKVTGSVSANLKKLVVPASIEYEGAEIPVTEIGDYAFEGSKLTSVKLGSNVKKVGAGAFAFSSKLKKATVKAGCEQIDDAAFFMCTALSKVTFNKNSVLESIGAGAFAGTAVTAFTVQDGVKSIGDASFSECKSLKKVTLGASLETVGEGAFSGCDSLTEIIKSDGNIYIEVYKNAIYSKDYKVLLSGAALRGENNEFPEGLETISPRAFEENTGIISVQFPGSLKYIGEGAFLNCTALVSAGFSEGVKIVDENAFYGCSALTSLNIPASVETISGNPFKYCPMLKNLTVDEGSSTYRMVDDLLISYDGKILVAAPAVSGIVALDKGIRSINEYAFCGNSSVKAVKLNKNLEKVGYGAFHDCEQLILIQLEEGTSVEGMEEIEDKITK